MAEIVNGGVFIISGLQTNQAFGIPANSFRGIRFPLTYQLESGTNIPKLLFPLSTTGNALPPNNNNHEAVPSSIWNSAEVLWQRDGSYLRNWNFAQKAWWYIQSDTLSLTTNRAAAAELTIVTLPSGKTTIQDLNTQLYLDWASAYGQLPDDAFRSGPKGLQWLSAPYEWLDAWQFHSLPLADKPIICDPSWGQSAIRVPYAALFGPRNVAQRSTPSSGTDLTGSLFLEPRDAEYVMLEASEDDSGRVLSIRTDGLGLEWAVPQFVTAGNQPGARHILRYSRTGGGMVYFQPNALSRTRYALYFDQNPAAYDPSFRPRVRVGVVLCDDFDQTLPAGGCSSLLDPPIPRMQYERLRLVRWGEASPENQTYSIQDSLTGLCLSATDFTLVPCAGGGGGAKFWEGKTYSPALPLARAEQLGAMLYGVPGKVHRSYYEEECETSQRTVGVVPDPDDRQRCCRGEFYKIQPNPVSWITPATGTHIAWSDGLVMLTNTTLNASVFADPVVERDGLWVSTTANNVTRYRRVLEGRLVLPLPPGQTRGFQWVGRIAPSLEGSLALQFPQLGPGFGGSSVGGLVRLDIRNDGDHCDPEYCPFGLGCGGWINGLYPPASAMKEYCGTADRQGFPRYKSELYCSQWCSRTIVETCLSTSAEAFCPANPESPSCMCQEYENTPAFRRISSVFEAIPGYGEAGLIIPSPFCWAAPCTLRKQQPDGPVITARMIGENGACPDLRLTFCNIVIEVINAGSVVIDHNSFVQVCGSRYPTGSNPPSVEVQWIKDNPGAFSALLIVCVGAFIGIVILASRIVDLRGGGRGGGR